MSKRAKFTFITWVGKNIGGLQLAKISTDKAMVKEIVQVWDSEALEDCRAVVWIIVSAMAIKEQEALMAPGGLRDTLRG